MPHRIAVLPGDGVGPEVTAEAVATLAALGLEIDFQEALVGGAAIDALGEPLPAATLDLCRTSDAILLGAVGGPKWDRLPPAQRPEIGALLPLRKELGLFANLRPARTSVALRSASPLKNPDIDLLVVRELTGGLYFGARGVDPEGRTFDTMTYTETEIERIARVGFEAAQRRRGKVTSVDKANVLECSRLWRRVVERVALDFPGVTMEHMLVDNASMQLVRNPGEFDVILTENMFGDILSDEAAAVTGSLGLLPSASLGASGPGLFEPVHGSAPDIAGQGIANPLAAILSAAMLLRHGLGRGAEADRVEAAVERTLGDGVLSRDLGGTATTAELGSAVRDRL